MNEMNEMKTQAMHSHIPHWKPNTVLSGLGTRTLVFLFCRVVALINYLIN